jgi:hypothetical protein
MLGEIGHCKSTIQPSQIEAWKLTSNRSTHYCLHIIETPVLAIPRAACAYSMFRLHCSLPDKKRTTAVSNIDNLEETNFFELEDEQLRQEGFWVRQHFALSK